MRILAVLALLPAPLLLAACGSPAEGEHMRDMPAEDHDMSSMGTVKAETSASAEGTVTAIDAESGTLTIDHGPVPALEWPQMVMAFEASEQIQSEVAIGDQIAFEFSSGSEGNVVTSVAKK